MEPFARMGEVCSEEDVDIPDTGMMNVKKKSRQKYFDSDDSTINLIFNKMGVFQENESFKRHPTIQRGQILVS